MVFVVAEIVSLRDTEEKSKQQHSDLLLREKVLVRRLAAKEQEMQEYAVINLIMPYLLNQSNITVSNVVKNKY